MRAGSQLAAMAATANDGGMLPEQVWDQNPPSGQPGFAAGDADVLGDAAGLDARAVHPSGLVDRRRASGRAAVGRGLPVRA